MLLIGLMRVGYRDVSVYNGALFQKKVEMTWSQIW